MHCGSQIGLYERQQASLTLCGRQNRPPKPPQVGNKHCCSQNGLSEPLQTSNTLRSSHNRLYESLQASYTLFAESAGKTDSSILYNISTFSAVQTDSPILYNIPTTFAAVKLPKGTPELLQAYTSVAAVKTDCPNIH